MGKIAFIRPKQPILFDAFNPPLGPMYLSSILKSKGHDVCLLDLRVQRKNPKAMIEWLEDRQPDIVGISALSSEAAPTSRIAAHVKERWPDLPVVIGGAYPTTTPERAMEDPNVDYSVLGEAEESFPRLVDHLLEGEGLPTEIPGIVYRDNGEVLQNPAGPPIQDLDSIAMPDWGLIDRKAYFHITRNQHFYKHRAYMPLFTTRGCPFQCLYCHQVFGKKFRVHSSERVI